MQRCRAEAGGGCPARESARSAAGRWQALPRLRRAARSVVRPVAQCGFRRAVRRDVDDVLFRAWLCAQAEWGRTVPPPATPDGRSSIRRAICSRRVAPGFIREVVSACRQPVEFLFQLLAGVFEGVAVGFLRNKDRTSPSDTDSAEG